MTMSPVGATSLWIAAARALESESETPLFIDHYARDLAGDLGFAVMNAMRQLAGPTVPRGADPLLSLRTRFIDEGVLEAVRDRERPQVVIMAAGMDTRAFRLDWPSGTTLFEMDRDDVFDHKEPILARLGASPRCDRRLIRVDLAGEWLSALLDAGFDRSRPAAFIVEGLLMYLETAAAERFFDGLSQAAADGSWLGGDIVNAEMITSAYSAPLLKKLDELGCPWRFGASEPEAWLAARGWHGGLVSPGEPRAHFGRWPYPVLPRGVPGLPRIHFMSSMKGAPATEVRGVVSRDNPAEHYTWGRGCDGWHLLRRDSLNVIAERMPPGTSEVLHRHRQATQFFYVLDGDLHIDVDGRMHHVPQGSGLEVRRGEPHQVFNNGSRPAEFLVISQPPSHGDREDL